MYSQLLHHHHVYLMSVQEFHTGFHREKSSVDSLHKDCLSTLKTLGLTGSSLEKVPPSRTQVMHSLTLSLV